jgi:hypothetical protein
MKYTPLYIYFYGRIMISKSGNVKCIPAGLKKGDYYMRLSSKAVFFHKLKKGGNHVYESVSV